MHSPSPTQIFCNEHILLTKTATAVGRSHARDTRTVHGNVSFRPGQQVLVKLLEVLGLRDRTTEVVDEDGGRAIGLQQGPQEPLQEGDELLVLRGLAHLRA